MLYACVHTLYDSTHQSLQRKPWRKKCAHDADYVSRDSFAGWWPPCGEWQISDDRKILTFLPLGSLKCRGEYLGGFWVEHMSTMSGPGGEANFVRTIRTFSKLWHRSHAVPTRHVYLIANVFSLTLTLNICGYVWPLSIVPLHVCSVKLQSTHNGMFPLRPSFVLIILWQHYLSPTIVPPLPKEFRMRILSRQRALILSMQRHTGSRSADRKGATCLIVLFGLVTYARLLVLTCIIGNTRE